MGTVKSDVFTTDEVLSVGDGGGHGEPDSVLAITAPGGRAKRLGISGGAEEGLVDLVPVSSAVVGSGIISGADVDLRWARVKHASTSVGLLQANLVTGLDSVDAGGSNSSLVAGEVRIERGDGALGRVDELGGHVAVLMLPDVGVGGALHGIVDDELIERVVGVDRGDEAENGGDDVRGLHDCYLRRVTAEVSARIEAIETS